jgi:hypothetical protein
MATKRKSVIFICLKIIYSALVSEVQGKLNGSKLYKGRNNQLITNKVKPKNVNSFSQAAIRSIFRTYAATWRTLNDAQRQGWVSAAKQRTRKNKIGTSHNFTGFNLYIAENQRNLFVNPGAAPLTDPPSQNLSIPLYEMANPIAVGGVAPSMTINVPNIGANYGMILYATPPLSAGKSFVKGQYRLIYIAPPGVATPLFDILAYYQQVHGNPTTGQKIWFRWETFSQADSKVDVMYGATSAHALVS